MEYAEHMNTLLKLMMVTRIMVVIISSCILYLILKAFFQWSNRNKELTSAKACFPYLMASLLCIIQAVMSSVMISQVYEVLIRVCISIVWMGLYLRNRELTLAKERIK